LRRDDVVSDLPPPSNLRALAVVEAALHRIREEEGWRLSVGALAARLGVSSRQLRYAARRAYGVPIKACMVRARLENTLARLRETDGPIKAFAEALGYSAAALLARDVRRLTGFVPSRYRAPRRLALRQTMQTGRA